jgi:hypothetical protein
MAWRLQLSERSIRRLDILTGKPSLLAVWAQPNRVVYLDLQTGAKVDDRLIEEPQVTDHGDERWQKFVKSNTAPNGAHLPFVRTRQTAIYTTSDGNMHVYSVNNAQVYLEANGREIRLDIGSDAKLAAVSLDRTLGLLAALDRAGKLHIFQQHIRVGVVETGLTLQDDLQPEIAVSHGGTSIFATDGQQVVLIDPSGKVRKRLELHYTAGALACSPDGKLLVTSDVESGVVRIYSGVEMTATHQRFAVDLLADAKRVQHGTGGGLVGAALGALALNNKGVLAFALAGMVCVTNLARLKSLPRKQAEA